MSFPTINKMMMITWDLSRIIARFGGINPESRNRLCRALPPFEAFSFFSSGRSENEADVIVIEVSLSSPPVDCNGVESKCRGIFKKRSRS